MNPYLLTEEEVRDIANLQDLDEDQIVYGLDPFWGYQQSGRWDG